MADKKISELTNITGANLADADEFVVVDTSADETKAITYGELKKFTGDVTVSGAITATGGDLATLDLSAIDTSIADTAVDVFVYDTRKDSDGGAWRKRTQHTSWYNETLNTATRGSRREFPAMAVIVAEADKVTIYDGDDPALPMWMVFNKSSQYFLDANSSAAWSSNGVLCISGSGNGVVVINFVSDAAKQYHTTGIITRVDPSIIKRNTAQSSTVNASITLVNQFSNDVAMTVLPNAPIDPATGLPVPTIAVATAGGVSVIKDDGTVVDITAANSAYGLSRQVHIDRQQGLWFELGNSSQNGGSWVYYFAEIPSADTTLTQDSKVGTGADATAYFTDVLGYGDLQYLGDGGSFSSDVILSEGVIGGKGTRAKGLNKVSVNATTPSEGMVAYTTSTYNTGWMNGGIKGAFLSSTDTASLVGGVNIITDTSMYPLALSTGSIHTNTSANLVSGNFYRVQFQVQWSADASGSVAIYATTTGLPYLAIAADPSNTTTLDYVVKAEDGGYVFGINAGPLSAGTATIVSPSVSVADADRSVNNKGLIVNGTVTRSPVATGAELVAYSGFSASNYLEQPYNPDLDFGTGDFCVMGWVKPVSAAADYIFDCRQSSVSPTGFFIYINESGQPTFYTQQAGSTTFASSSAALSLGVWQHVVGLRKSGVNYVYLNGTLVGSTSGATQNVNDASRKLVVGNSVGLFSYHALQGSLALWRISATAPTAEQIARIYQDERPLFTENAACTIAGTSDAVTALAHDDDTGLLHVGTSAGRSVFQGLRRVSNTTTAVGTAISAANGLVAEE